MGPATLIFLLVVIGTYVQTVAAISTRRSLRPATRTMTCFTVFVFWIAIPGLLAAADVMGQYAPMPSPPMILIALLGLATIVTAFTKIGTALATVPLVWLVAFQSFRIPIEWWLHQRYLEGTVPVQMTFAGRNFDIISGVTALLLGLWLALGRPPNALVLVWNLLGLGLLANVVAVALLSTPVPSRVFLNDPPNLLPSTFPDIWWLTFLVPAALFGHLLLFRALRRGRQIADSQ